MQPPASTSGINHIPIFTHLFKISPSYYISWCRWLVQNQAKEDYCLTLSNNNLVPQKVNNLKNQEQNSLRDKLLIQKAKTYFFTRATVYY